MKHAHLVVAAALSFALVACGGSGGDSHNSSTGNPTTGTGSSGSIVTQPRIEAVVEIPTTNLNPAALNKYSDSDLLDPTKVDPTDLIDPTVSGVEDPENIEVNEAVVFQLVGYGSSGQRVILPAGRWTTSDTTQASGNLSADTGRFVAGSQATNDSLTVKCIYQGVQYTAPYIVKPRQVRLLGRIASEAQPTQGVRDVQIAFYAYNQAPTGFDENGNATTSPVYVGRVRTSYDGTFRASLPADASALLGDASTYMRMVVQSNTIPSGYYRSFLYSYRVNGTLSTYRYRTETTPQRFGQDLNSGAVLPAPVATPTGEPVTSGTRRLVDTSNGNALTNGTILLTPTSLYPANSTSSYEPDDATHIQADTITAP